MSTGLIKNFMITWIPVMCARFSSRIVFFQRPGVLLISAAAVVKHGKPCSVLRAKMTCQALVILILSYPIAVGNATFLSWKCCSVGLLQKSSCNTTFSFSFERVVIG